MAEITAASKGKKRYSSPKVDLTPMVDLGFLLVSFFVFTNTLFEPKVLSLILPDESGIPTKIPESGAVTLIARAESIYYYAGNTPASRQDLTVFNYNQKDALRTTLLQLKRRLIAANGNDEKLMVLIKPGDDVDLGRLVEVLDEMAICDIGRYSITELSEVEKSF